MRRNLSVNLFCLCSPLPFRGIAPLSFARADHNFTGPAFVRFNAGKRSPDRMDEGRLAHKLVIIGDSDVGKTSLVRCFDEQTFDPTSNPTVGASFLSKTVTVKEKQVILNIWDTAGQERYRSLIPTYAHGAHAAILCYDVNSQPSFASLDAWLDSLLRFASPDCLVYVVGNKVDLPEIVRQSEAKQWAQDHGAHCMFTSARERIGVTELFEAVAEALIGFGGPRNTPKIEPRVDKGCC